MTRNIISVTSAYAISFVFVIASTRYYYDQYLLCLLIYACTGIIIGLIAKNYFAICAISYSFSILPVVLFLMYFGDNPPLIKDTLILVSFVFIIPLIFSELSGRLKNLFVSKFHKEK